MAEPPVLNGADQRALAVTVPPLAPEAAVPIRAAPGLAAKVLVVRLTSGLSPTAVRASTETVYAVAGVRPVNVWLRASGASSTTSVPRRTTYPVTAEPPSARGSCQPTVTEELVADEVRVTGAGATGSAHVVA